MGCRTAGTIDDFWRSAQGRPAGFDNLRVIFALAVILWHTIIVCRGVAGEAWYWSGPLRPLIYFVVPSFFSLSGFVVAASLARNDLLSFAVLRVLRIYPALAFEVVLSALLIGTCATQVSAAEYFTHPDFVNYLLNVTGWIQYQLPGVFVHNPFGRVVNLQLWTVPYELECYLALIGLAVVGVHRRPLAFLAVPILLTLAALLGVAFTHHVLRIVSRPPGQMIVVCFLFGACLFLLRDRVRVRRSWMAAAAGAYAALVYNRFGIHAVAPLVAYLTVCVGVHDKRLPLVGILTPYAYGIYLFGFPMQQLVAWLLPGQRYLWVNFGLGLALTIIAAAVSWHMVELPVARRKRQIIGLVLALQDRARSRLLAVFSPKHRDKAQAAPRLDA